jgi:hypothetical protein
MLPMPEQPAIWAVSSSSSLSSTSAGPSRNVGREQDLGTNI